MVPRSAAPYHPTTPSIAALRSDHYRGGPTP